MLAVTGCLEGLSRLLEEAPQPQLAQEAAWLLASAAAAAANSQLALISRTGCFTQALAHLRSLQHHEVRLPAFLELELRMLALVRKELSEMLSCLCISNAAKI